MPPIRRQALNLHFLVPQHFHNAWTVVAYALIVSAFVKSVCDYVGTYLVNYAGFGMITDLRNDLYDAVLRRSVAFFQKHTTGTLLSTLINDIERVQFAMSSVLGDFLQQFFTLMFHDRRGDCLTAGKLAWVLLLFVPVVISSARRIGRRVRQTTRKGQDKLAEIQNILHETITGNRIVKAFGMELWEMNRFRRAARRLFRANLKSVSVQAISSPLMDALGSVAIALLLLLGREQIRAARDDGRLVHCVPDCGIYAVRSGAEVRAVLQQLSAGAGGERRDLQVHGRAGRCSGEEARVCLEGIQGGDPV